MVRGIDASAATSRLAFDWALAGAAGLEASEQAASSTAATRVRAVVRILRLRVVAEEFRTRVRRADLARRRTIRNQLPRKSPSAHGAEVICKQRDARHAAARGEARAQRRTRLGDKRVMPHGR